jgi:hypothetical protein
VKATAQCRCNRNGRRSKSRCSLRVLLGQSMGPGEERDPP